MIEFVGYNDARAIKAYNKKNLAAFSIGFGMICLIASIVALLIRTYELLFIAWGVYLFFTLLSLFAVSFSRYDDKAFKKSNIKTRRVFKISELKLYRDGKEIKDVKRIKVFPYETYLFLECKKSYYYVPLEESNVPKETLINALYEVIRRIESGKDYE